MAAVLLSKGSILGGLNFMEVNETFKWESLLPKKGPTSRATKLKMPANSLTKGKICHKRTDTKCAALSYCSYL
jgi:hypothetical protein